MDKVNQNKVFDMREFLRTYMPVFALIGIILFFAVITNGTTLSIRNIKQIGLQSCTYIVAGLGIMFTISLGNMDMSLDGIVCLGGALGLLAAEKLSIGMVFPVIFIVAILCELFIGITHILLNINSVIVSFAVSFFGKGIAGFIIANRSAGLKMPSEFSGLYNKGLFYLITLISIIVIAAIFHYTKLGKYNMFIGSNLKAARVAGINVNKYKLLAYLMAGIMMGLATLLIVSRAGSAGATSGAGFQIDVLLMVVIGGASLNGGTKTKIFSAIVGVITLLCLQNGLTVVGFSPEMIGLVQGAIFLVAVTLTFDRDGVPYIL
jgi:ribose transport system permease protein